MTEYELIDAAASFQNVATTHFMNFVTILFAYLICAYLVGDRLTRLQLWVVNVLYTVFTAQAGLFSYVGWNRFFVFTGRLVEQFPQPQMAGLGVPSADTALIAVVPLTLFAYFAGILFMMNKRRASDLS